MLHLSKPLDSVYDIETFVTLYFMPTGLCRSSQYLFLRMVQRNIVELKKYKAYINKY